jgi:hypothetical protein
MSDLLPPQRLRSRPNAELLRKKAKELRRAARAQTADALQVLEQFHPRYHQLVPARLGLQDAQTAVARQYGYASWPRLMEAVAAVQHEPELKKALDAEDMAHLQHILDADPNAHGLGFGVVDRRGRVDQVMPLAYADQCEWLEAMRLLLTRGAEIKPLEEALFGTCEAHDLEHMLRLLSVGVDPNRARNDGWDCEVLYGIVQTYHRSAPEHSRACVNALIAAGARYDDGPDMDMHRGDLARLEQRLRQDPDLVHHRFSHDYGDHLTLRGVTLLHLAVEYHYIDCIELLLRHGADLNAQAAIGPNGVGGQTPFFHAIGTNQGKGFHVFEFLLEKEPDLGMKARIQGKGTDDGKVMDCIYKGQDHSFDEVLELTVLGYAELFVEGPDWRSGRREAERLRDLYALLAAE